MVSEREVVGSSPPAFGGGARARCPPPCSRAARWERIRLDEFGSLDASDDAQSGAAASTEWSRFERSAAPAPGPNRPVGAGTGTGGTGRFSVGIHRIHTLFGENAYQFHTKCCRFATDLCGRGDVLRCMPGRPCEPRHGMRTGRRAGRARVRLSTRQADENCRRNRPWTVCRPRPDPFRRRNPPGESRRRRVAWRRAAGRLRRRRRRSLLGAQATGSPGVPGPRRGRRVAP